MLAVGHPIELVVEDDLQRTRPTVFFRPLLAIPHLVWLWLWGIAAAIAIVVAWLAALVTASVPEGIHEFLARYLRYQVHVYAYVTLTADPFPPFGGAEGAYPVDLRVAAPAPQNRLTVFVRILLALPAAILAGVLNYLSTAIGFFAWFACLALGRIPEGMRNLQAFSIRYHAQTSAYEYLLTERYPSLDVGLQA